jgi:sugar phosphate isomerase/epimerase
MIIAMHGLSTMHCNVATEIRMARECGFDAVELVESKLLRYLDQGYPAGQLVPIFKKHNMRCCMINALKWIERSEPVEREALMKEARRLCAAARDIGCPQIQLVPFCLLSGRPYSEIIRLTARNVSDISKIGKDYGIRFQLEPIAWSPIHSVRQTLELLDAAGRPENVGMVIDFWHLWTGRETAPKDVAALPAGMIYGVHFCDGKRPPKDATWDDRDEPGLRSFLPGEGDIPIPEWVAAVKSTGYDGYWSSELLSPKHWEWDLWDLARETKARMERYITS